MRDVPCAVRGCNWMIAIDEDHPWAPDGPFLCHEHDPAPDEVARRFGHGDVDVASADEHREA